MVIRAIFFDFYSVWVPDIFSEYLREAAPFGPQVVSELQTAVDQYFRGQASPAQVATAFRYRLSRPDIDSAQFTLQESNISPAVADFMRELHGHFVKLGVLANLGTQELQLLTAFNAHNQVFEAITSPLSLAVGDPLLSQQVFAAALQAIGEPPQSSLVVSGNQAYLDFAESMGIANLAFDGLPQLKQTLEEIVTREAS